MSSSTSPLAELLADLDRALAALGLRWYLFGAQAAILYGVARLTADVDVTVDAGSRIPVDVVLAGPGLEDLFFSRVEERSIGDLRVPVASAADIVTMKILAGRPKDAEMSAPTGP